MPRRGGYCTIEVSEQLHGRLKALRFHPRQTYAELVRDMVDLWERNRGYELGWFAPYDAVPPHGKDAQATGRRRKPSPP